MRDATSGTGESHAVTGVHEKTPEQGLARHVLRVVDAEHHGVRLAIHLLRVDGLPGVALDEALDVVPEAHEARAAAKRGKQRRVALELAVLGGRRSAGAASQTRA